MYHYLKDDSKRLRLKSKLNFADSERIKQIL